jgi:gliding motility-associated-like protein
VAPAPEFKIDISPSDKVAPGTPVTLTAVNENPNMVISSFAWADPATLSCSVCYKTIATPFVTTTYTFTATSIYGCTSTDVITITVGCENSQVFIPNSFTPNGDGVNDRFFVQAKGISKVTKFLIFGRWGQLVYERYNIDANDAAAGWDGQYKDVMMPPGVYYYVVDATCIQNGTEFTYKGDVTIVK